MIRRCCEVLICGVALLLPISLLAQKAPVQDTSKPTPRTADGKPDLNGVWVAGPDMMKALIESNKDANGSIRIAINAQKLDALSAGRGAPALPKPGDPNYDAEAVRVAQLKPGDPGYDRDKAAVARRKLAPNQPPYKPELQAKVKDLADHQTRDDPAFYCKPAGVPRIGPPSQIIQTPTAVIFLYDSENTFRYIPTDGRPHRADADDTYMGDSIGSWDGDTLVVDVTHLTDDTWFSQDGAFHSTKAHVVERLRRDGDVLTYQATVDDPEVFTRPWLMNPRRLKPSSGLLEEAPPCRELDESNLVNFDRH